MILTIKEKARLSRKTIPAICAKMLALEPLRTFGFSSILSTSFMVLFERSEADRIFFRVL